MTTRPRAGGRIGLYMVGARDGDSNTSLPAQFADDLFYVFFEADESAIPQIESRNDPAKSRVFPYCLADSNGAATFYHNYDPFTSSLLQIDAELDLSQFAQGRSYRFSDVMRTVREEPVQTRTLDSLDLLADPDVPGPTVISLDTQGSELAILEGGSALISEHTAAIVAEAEFVPFYRGQPLFGDVCARLSELGFTFIDFAYGPFALDPFDAQIGLRGRPMAGFCDALFFRKPSAATSVLQLAQVAFIAFYWAQAGYAFHCLELALAQDPTLAAVPEERLYRTFLLEMAKARTAMPALVLPTFDDMFPTYELSAIRFNKDVSLDTLKQLNSERAQAIKRILLEQSDALAATLALNNSPVENVMARYGFMEQAKVIKQRRIDDATAMCNAHYITVERETKVVGQNDS